MSINPSKPELKQLSIKQLRPGQYQPRRQFEQTALLELAASIQSAGLIQPIIVRPIGGNHYEIIAGERRWRAAQLAKLDYVNCLVNHYSDEQAIAATTIENINRVDLNPIEEAQAYQRMTHEFRYTHEEVAAVVGCARPKITNALRLLQLDKRLQQGLIDGELTAGHGKVLAGLPENQQYAFAEQCVQKGWSVRQLEQEIKKLNAKEAQLSVKQDIHLAHLGRRISDQLCTPVVFEADQEQASGWLKIRYFNSETLDGLLQKIGVENE